MGFLMVFRGWDVGTAGHDEAIEFLEIGIDHGDAAVGVWENDGNAAVIADRADVGLLIDACDADEGAFDNGGDFLRRCGRGPGAAITDEESEESGAEDGS